MKQKVKQRDVENVISLPHAPIRDKFVNELYLPSLQSVLTKDDKLCGLHDVILTSMKTLHRVIHKIEDKDTKKGGCLDEMVDKEEELWKVWDFLEQGLKDIHEYRKNELVNGMQWTSELKTELANTPNSKPFMLFGPEMAETFLIYKFRQSNSLLNHKESEINQLKAQYRKLASQCKDYGIYLQ